MRSPVRMLLMLGIPIGLLFALVSPPWTAGADEATHFARSVDMAHGNLMPQDTADGTGSAIPRRYRTDQDLVAANYLSGRAPLTLDLLGDLFASAPSWDETVFVDTRPTTASSPVGYLPASAAMLIPNATGMPGVVVLWAGRLGDLAVYLALTALAVRLATAFRWILVLTALLPLNLALAASVTPDALTMGALAVVLALWTRVWSPPEGDRAWSDRRTAAAVGGAALLLALTKPPYFLVLALFPGLWALRRRDRTAGVAAAAASVAGLVGLAFTAVNSSSNYQSVTSTLVDTIEFQPDLQRERLLSDPLGFLWASVRTFVSEFDDYVQGWTRQLGFWTVELPLVVPWLVLLGVLVAALRLDGADLDRLRAWTRGLFVAGTVAFVLVLYGASYVYFDDTEDGARIGREMDRYFLPLFTVAVLGLLLRREPRRSAWRDRVDALPAAAVTGAVAGLLGVAALAAVLTWTWLGAA